MTKMDQCEGCGDETYRLKQTSDDVGLCVACFAAVPITRPPLTPNGEAYALYFDPWGMDDSDYRGLADKFVTTRKPAVCTICLEAIPVGSRVRAKTEVYDGDCMTFKFCPECCWCMAHRDEDTDDDPSAGMERMDARYELGRKNARKGETPHE